MALLPLPMFRHDAFPENERDAIMNISFQIMLLDSYLLRFEAAVQLCQFVMRTPSASEWAGIATRDAVATVFHFGTTLTHNFLFKECPTFSKSVKHVGLRSARSDFNKAFPDWIELRNSVWHSSEKSASKQAVAYNSAGASKEMEALGIKIEGDAKIYIVDSVVNGTRAVATHRNAHRPYAKTVGVECTPQNLSALVRIRNSVVSVFDIDRPS